VDVEGKPGLQADVLEAEFAINEEVEREALALATDELEDFLFSDYPSRRSQQWHFGLRLRREG
jgi:hypothetical protein